MRSTKTLALAVAAGGAAILASDGDLVANGTIDTSGATITTGSAPSQGAVTIEESGDFGALPADDNEYGALEDPEALSFDESIHRGLGGPNFHATTDATFPAGTYDFGSFTVDQGVTVSFVGDVSLRITKNLRVDGRLSSSQGSPSYRGLRVDCSGDVVIVGHDDAVTTGLFAEDAQSGITIDAGGTVDVSADSGAKVYFHGVDDGGSIVAGSSGASYVSDAIFEPGGVSVGGDLTVTDCEVHGNSPRGSGFQAPRGSLTVTRGSFTGMWLVARDDIEVTDVTGSAGVRFNEWTSEQGSIRVLGTSTIVADQELDLIAREDIEIGDGCTLRQTGESPYGGGIYLSASRGHVTVGSGAAFEHASSGGIQVNAGTNVELHGSISGNSGWARLFATGGDVVLASGSSIDLPSAALDLFAAGAVTAEGGNATVTAGEIDIRSHTGDTDLDVATMRAANAKLVARSNGVVRLRGSFSAARDIQAISLADAIDVHGATLATDDTSSAPSGFVRLATYAATSIDASSSTLTTGSSNSQSGDVLIQVEQGGSAVTSAAMKVARVTARRTPDGVTTQIQGTIKSPGLRTIRLTGSAQLTAGALTRRLFLDGVTSRLRGTSDVVTVKLTRISKTKVKFVLEIREAVATAGEQKTLRLARAGFRADGKFRRPKAK